MKKLILAIFMASLGLTASASADCITINLGCDDAVLLSPNLCSMTCYYEQRCSGFLPGNSYSYQQVDIYQCNMFPIEVPSPIPPPLDLM